MPIISQFRLSFITMNYMHVDFLLRVIITDNNNIIYFFVYRGIVPQKMCAHKAYEKLILYNIIPDSKGLEIV